MDWKNQITKTPYLVLFIFLITIGVGTSYALITITLDGDVVVTGDLSVGTDNPSDDDFIRFDGGNENIQWDESETLFRFSDHIATGGHAQFGSIIPDGVNRFGDGTPQSSESMTGFGDLYLADDLEVTDNLFVGGDIDCEGCIGYSDIMDPSARIPSQIPKFNVLTTFNSVDNVGWDSSITIGADGLPVISYQDATNGQLNVAKCNNSSCSSATLTIVDSIGFVGNDSSIAIGVDGFPVISYQANGSDLKVAKCNNSSCSSAILTTLDSSVDVGHDTSIAIGVEGLPVISYNAFTAGDLKFARCNNTNCSSATLSTVDSADFVGFDTSIAMGADGLPVISYHDRTHDVLRVAHCGNPSCNSGNTITTVDATGKVGENSSITIGIDSFPVISYYDSTNTALKAVHCTNASCSTSDQPRTLDNAGNVGHNTSITIGVDGRPVISYYDTSDSYLKVAKCNSLACFSATTTIVDSAGIILTSNSITIGVDGRPVISYYDDTNGDLNVAKCANAYCLSLWSQR